MQQKQHMSAVRLAGLLAVYFIGYLWLVPRASVRLTLWLAPQALYVNTWVMGACYLVVILLSLLLSWREWKASLHAFRQAPVRCLFRIGWGCVQVLVLNVVLSMLCALLSGQGDSANQEVIRQNVSVAPLFMLYSVLVFAPIVEESVFRGGIFAFCRRHFGFWPAAVLSALAFGGIHVMDSLFTAQYSDLIYIIVYGGIGLVNAWYYEHYGGILSSAGVHMLNNLVSYLMM